jgi:hypothetical protein
LLFVASSSVVAQGLGSSTGLYSGGDGSSCDAAVIVNLADRKTGIAAEHRWLQEKFQGGTRGRQALARGRDGKTYDTIEWIKPDGSPVWVCFDITQFAGKR